uniref:Uncharacterized protein n=1 Tax=Anguilla anguilla TaxID=7936 RepID=A0A0E9PUB9_ANGAN
MFVYIWRSVTLFLHCVLLRSPPFLNKISYFRGGPDKD